MDMCALAMLQAMCLFELVNVHFVVCLKVFLPKVFLPVQAH